MLLSYPSALETATLDTSARAPTGDKEGGHTRGWYPTANIKPLRSWAFFKGHVLLQKQNRRCRPRWLVLDSFSQGASELLQGDGDAIKCVRKAFWPVFHKEDNRHLRFPLTPQKILRLRRYTNVENSRNCAERNNHQEALSVHLYISNM